MANLTKKIVKNSIFGGLEFIWPIFLAFIATPYIVHKLGNDVFGIYALVGVTLGFLSVLDLGMTGATIKYVAEYHEKENNEMVGKTISLTLLVYFIIGAIGAVIVFLFTPLLVNRILKIPLQFIEVAKFAFYVAAIGFFVNLMLGVFAAIPKAIQRYDVSTKLSIIIGTVSTLATLVILYLGYRLREIVILGLVISIISFFIYIIVAKKLLPSMKIKPSFDKKLFLKLFRFGGFFLISSMAAVVLFQLDKIIIGSFLGLAIVTFYVIPGNIAVKIQGLIGAATNIAFPVSSSLSGKNQMDKLKKLYIEGTRGILILATLISVPLIVFANKFLLYWLGPDFAAQSSNVMRVLVLTYYFISIGAVIWAISLGVGRSKINAISASAMAFFNILLLFLFIKPWGILGASVAYFLSVIVVVPVMIAYIERKILGFSGFKFWKIFSKIFIVAIVQTLVSVILVKMSVNLITTLIFMAISAASFIAIYVLFGFWEEGDKKILNIFLEKFLSRRI